MLIQCDSQSCASIRLSLKWPAHWMLCKFSERDKYASTKAVSLKVSMPWCNVQDMMCWSWKSQSDTSALTRAWCRAFTPFWTRHEKRKPCLPRTTPVALFCNVINVQQVPIDQWTGENSKLFTNHQKQLSFVIAKWHWKQKEYSVTSNIHYKSSHKKQANMALIRPLDAAPEQG